jgi:hypothetical protein
MPRQVSLKEIVKAIDKAIEELGPATRKKSMSAEDARIQRTRKVLEGMRESVEGCCFPDFEIPVP